MHEPLLIKHTNRAIGLRFLGLGPNLTPVNGIKKLHDLFKANTSWANQRCAKDIKKMIAKSNIIVSAWDKKKMIGFGRATTDEIYRATLWDIVVDKNYQRLGIGGKIINLIINDKNLIQVEKIYIMTTQCEKFYMKMGFQKESIQNLMLLEK
tara:strand:+ start:659 stop:1114 length:456 start_codon:yes stop_codon:yes gene_type:complete